MGSFCLADFDCIHLIWRESSITGTVSILYGINPVGCPPVVPTFNLLLVENFHNSISSSRSVCVRKLAKILLSVGTLSVDFEYLH